MDTVGVPALAGEAKKEIPPKGGTPTLHSKLDLNSNKIKFTTHFDLNIKQLTERYKMSIKKNIIIAVLSFTIIGTLNANTEWITNFQKATELSKEKGIPILIDFSGSDWCHWCVKLDKEVFNTIIFKDYAKDNLILFMADFPSKTQQSASLIKQNNELASKYGVRGYPTVLLLGADEKVLLRTGYKPGGPNAYIKSLESTVTAYKQKIKNKK